MNTLQLLTKWQSELSLYKAQEAYLIEINEYFSSYKLSRLRSLIQSFIDDIETTDSYLEHIHDENSCICKGTGFYIDSYNILQICEKHHS